MSARVCYNYAYIYCSFDRRNATGNRSVALSRHGLLQNRYNNDWFAVSIMAKLRIIGLRVCHVYSLCIDVFSRLLGVVLILIRTVQFENKKRKINLHVCVQYKVGSMASFSISGGIASRPAARPNFSFLMSARTFYNVGAPIGISGSSIAWNDCASSSGHEMQRDD